MLNILYGRAGTGKTRQIMLEIKRRMADGEDGMLLVVPEQYSHDAERQLCAVCGDSLSLHAEVLSFTRLCTGVFDETGGYMPVLDKSGQILVMHRALESVLHGLKVFKAVKLRTEMLESMLAAILELKSMCITTQKLEEMADKASTPLREKLKDFALILGAYNALLESYGGDNAERLSLLAMKIKESSVGKGHIYFDGFNDFTMQEMSIIEEILKKGADVTVCLTCDLDREESLPGYEDIFRIPRRTVAQLSHISGRVSFISAAAFSSNKGSEAAGKTCVPEMKLIEKHLFCDSFPQLQEVQKDDELCALARKPVTVYAAGSRYQECEYAAAIIRSLVCSGYRWRDIAVMARDFSQFESMCEQVFNRYGIPYFVSGSTDIQSKPPIALIDAALEIACTGFEYKSVFRYLKTGLSGLTTDEIALLENYVITWNIRGLMWQREWIMPPSGYKTGFYSRQQKEIDDALLRKLNTLRDKVVKPLVKLKESMSVQSPDAVGKTRKTRNASNVESKLNSLYAFITDIALPEQLIKKANDFECRGELRAAGEYKQLLNIIIDALDQMYTVLKDSELTAVEFRKLVSVVLSQHSVGVIPVSLDRVPLGGMAMSRRRDIKCLIIIGASDENLPLLTKNSGVLSDNERAELSKLNEDITSGLEERLFREMNMIYSTLTLPSEKLIMVYNTSGDGRPSFVVSRLCEMFGIGISTLTEEEYMSAAYIPYIEMLSKLKQESATINRTRLTEETTGKLYGKDILLSASSADIYYSCPYKYYLKSGLKLNQRKEAEFDSASAGVYMHHVLEGVISELIRKDMLRNADNEMIKKLVTKYTDEFIKDVLMSFEGRNQRFKYQFKRCEHNALQVVRDTVDELASSEFTPYGFEVNLSELSEKLRGFVDRVDIYENDEKLYIRIVDYKTRKKAYDFDLGDVLYGRDMQMLMYLFAIEKYGRDVFGKKPHPAGILYSPARDVIVSVSKNSETDEIEKKRQKDMRRSGLIINKPELINAMERGDSKRFLPLKTAKNGTFEGKCLVSDEQVLILKEHVNKKISQASSEIQSGRNDCRPYYKSETDSACTYCEFFPVCKFDEELGDEMRLIGKLGQEEVWYRLQTGNSYKSNHESEHRQSENHVTGEDQ